MVKYMKKTTKATLEQLLEEIDLDYLKDLFLVKLLSKENIAKQLNTRISVLEQLLKHYNLKRDSIIKHSLKNSSKRHKQFNEVINRISKEELYQYYVVEDHDYKTTPAHFGLKMSTFDKLCAYYGIKKDKSKTRYKGLDTASHKYGEGNANNWRKGQKTRIKNYGSLEESYRQGFEKIKQTNLQKYGSEIILNLDVHAKKKFTGPNEKFRKLLDRNHIEYDREFIVGTKSYDFKVDNFLIEINPTVTHNINWSPFGEHKGVDTKYHYLKTQLAKENGYRCIHVWDWDNLNKIILMLKSKNKIMARKCIIKELDNIEAKEFLDKNHLQNYSKCRIRIGLYYNEELVSVMTFGKPRYNKNYEWELIRYSSNKQVVGGAERLFNYFIKNYKPKSILSYCDNAKFEGKLYSKLGFTLEHKGIPTCHWYNLKTKEHYTDIELRQKGFSRLIHKCSAKEDNLEINDNKLLMLNEGFLQVFDCGQSRYIYKSL